MYYYYYYGVKNVKLSTKIQDQYELITFIPGAIKRFMILRISMTLGGTSGHNRVTMTQI